MLRKPDLYKKCISLRKKGLSYNEISEHIDVSNSTLSRWCLSVSLTRKQKERLVEKKRNSSFIKSLKIQAIKSKKEAKLWADKEINKISNNDKTLLIAGVSLYWAEGTRSGAGGAVELTNTDPEIIKIMMRFFRNIMCVPNDKFRIIVRIGEKGNVKKAKNYWSKITKVPQKNFRNPEILKLKENSKSLKKYPCGMCRIIIQDISFKRKMLNLIEGFSENINALVA